MSKNLHYFFFGKTDTLYALLFIFLSHNSHRRTKITPVTAHFKFFFFDHLGHASHSKLQKPNPRLTSMGRSGTGEDEMWLIVVWAVAVSLRALRLGVDGSCCFFLRASCQRQNKKLRETTTHTDSSSFLPCNRVSKDHRLRDCRKIHILSGRALAWDWTRAPWRSVKNKNKQKKSQTKRVPCYLQSNWASRVDTLSRNNT
jgi:hypothetical protein